MKMIKQIMMWMTVITASVIFAACSTSQTGSGSDTKITSLQTVINNAKSGDTINLSQYSDITDWDATVSKSVMLTGGTNLSGELTVAADGVVLDNVHGSLNVTTTASLKITGSSLGSLTIGGAGDANASQILSRSGNKLIIQMIYSEAGLVKVNRLNENDLTQLLVDDSKITTVEAYSETVTIVRSKTSSIKSFKAEAKSEFVFEDGASESLVAEKSGSKANEITSANKSSDAVYYGMKAHTSYEGVITENITPTDGVYSVAVAKGDDLWNEWFCAVITQIGTNGRIAFQVKTDKATYIRPTVKTAITGSGSSTIVPTKANEWTSVKAYTGNIEQGFTKLVLEVPADTSDEGMTIYIKDITYTELDAETIDDDAPAVITDPSYASFAAQGSITTSPGKVIFKSVSKDDGFNVSPLVLPVGDIYRISFTVTADKATDGFFVFPNVNNSEGNVGYSWGWVMTSLSANTPTTVVAYLGAVAGAYYPPYEELNDDINKNPYLKMWISAGNANTLAVENFKAEAVSIDNLSDANVKWLAYGGNITDLGAECSIDINGKGSEYGNSINWRMVFYGKNNQDWWAPINDNNTIICSTNYLIYDNRLGDDISITKQFNDDNFEITNNTESRITVKISFDKQSKKVIFSR